MILTRVAIIDADLIGRKRHRFPNLACMKLSAWYKSQDHAVQLKTDYNNLTEFDLVTISKVFEDTPIDENILQLSNVEYGGTGFFFDKAPPLPDYIEHIMPDYHLYDNWVSDQIKQGQKESTFNDYTTASIGFTTRGCIRQCPFCVNQNYKKASLHSPVDEFLDPTRERICLLDDNIFACKEWKQIFESLIATKKKFWYKQGMDERLLTDEKADILFNQSKYYGDYTFAFDNIKDADVIERKLQLIRRYTNVIPKFYVLCGFNHDAPNQYSDEFWIKDIIDTFERIRLLMQYSCLPYVMRFKDYELSPYRGIYITLARWCNQPNFFKKKSLRQYCRDVEGNTSALKYITEFEKKHPDIATKYFDMKFSEGK